MAIMVAGGLTFAIPGAAPAAYAEVTQSNTYLFVSAEGQDANNQFAEGNIIEVIVNDPTIGDTDEGEAEPSVTINGADLRMLQTANGDWRAYFAQAAAIAAIDGDGNELDYGVFCNANAANTVAGTGVDLSDTRGAYFPPGSTANANTNCETENASSPKNSNPPQDYNHPLIRETRDLTDPPGPIGFGQLGLENRGLWPFIQVFDFADEANVEITYNRAGTDETVTLLFDDPSESHSLDREKYPRGAEVLITIEDYALNIDPTDEDTWAFDTNSDGGLGAYYNLFDEDGNPVNIRSDTPITNYAGDAGIGEQIKIVRNGQDSSGNNPIIDCQVTKDFGIQNASNAGMDYLVTGDMGACLPNGNGVGTAASDIFTEDNFVIGFVESSSNGNQFINWAEDQRSNIVVKDNADRNRSFEVDYNDPGAISGVVGHFFAELTLGDSGATWNSGERIDFTVTDEDANTNPLAENDLTVADPDTRLVPSIRIGSPITLANTEDNNGNYNVTWYNLTGGSAPLPPPQPVSRAPVIDIIGDNPVRVNQNAAYVDDGINCTNSAGQSITTYSSNAMDIDTATLGDQTITYTCADSEGTTTATRTVTVTILPVITIKNGTNDVPTVTIAHGSGPYIDTLGATCTDGDSDNPTIRPDTSNVNTDAVGEYTVTYTCTDTSGNTVNGIRTVNVTDQAKPTITVTGGTAEISVDTDLNERYTVADDDATVTCTDAVDGTITVDRDVSAVDRTTPGLYPITYTCTDEAGLVDTAERTITVKRDDVPPVINGGNDLTPVTISQNAKADHAMMEIEAGVTCEDNLDSNPTLSNDHKTAVNLVLKDDYTVEFTCVDDSTHSTTATRIVTVGDDNTKPELSGVDDVTIAKDDPFDPKDGVECVDDTTLPTDLTVVSDVDTAIENDYRVAYICTDDAGNQVSDFRTVKVTSATTPEITITGGSAVTEGSPAEFTITANPAPDAPLDVNLEVADADAPSDFVALGDEGTGKTVTVPTSGSATFTVATTQDTTEEDNGMVTVTVQSGSGYTISTTDGSATVSVNDDDGAPTPVITIKGGSDVTEGGNAVFTITATPAPTEVLTVNLQVADDTTSDFVAPGDEGTKTRSITPAGTTTYPVATVQDTKDESNGVVTVTVQPGTGYTIGTQSSATVAVEDDDLPPPPPIALTNIIRDSDGWTDGEYELTIVGHSISERDIVLIDPNNEDFTPIPISVDNDGSINATAVITDISVEGRISLVLESLTDDTVQSDVKTVNVPPVLVLGSVSAGDWEVKAGGDKFTLDLTLTGSDGTGNDNIVHLYPVNASGHPIISDVEPIVVNLDDSRDTVTTADTTLAGLTGFRLVVAEDDVVITQSDIRRANIDTLASLSVTIPDKKWSNGNLDLILNITNSTNLGASEIHLQYTGNTDGNIDVDDQLLGGISGTADFTHVSKAGQDVEFYVEIDGSVNVDGTAVSFTDLKTTTHSVPIPDILKLNPIVVSGTWSSGAAPTLSLQISGSDGLDSDTQLTLDAPEVDEFEPIDVTSRGDNIAEIVSLSDVSVSGPTKFQFVAGEAKSQNQTVNILPVLTLTSVAPGTWKDGKISLQIEGSTLLLDDSHVINLASNATGFTSLPIPKSGDAAIIKNGVISGTMELEDISLSGDTVFYLESTVADKTAKSENKTAEDIPSVLTLTSVEPGSWTGASGEETIELVVRGTSGLPAGTTVQLQLDTGDSSLTPQPTDTLTTANNGDIFGSITFEIRSQAGKDVKFNLTATIDKVATSNAFPVLLPNITSTTTTSVDMTPTPVSFFTTNSGFPPITRAVINDISEMPAIHSVVLKERPSPPTDKDEIYTFTTSVESFSDRMRLSEPSADITLNFTGNSAVVISDWKKPEFADGVTTLFNWNFDSLAKHASITGVYLADNETKVLLSKESKGLIDLADPENDKSEYINANLTGNQIDLIITLNGDVNHICEDITLVADYFMFGQKPDGERVNDAIYRIEVEEVTPNSDMFGGTIEYVMLNQLNVHNSETYTSLRAIDVDASIIVHEDFTDEDSVRINYFDLGADGVSTQIAIQREAPTHSGVVSFDMENYKIADTVTITVEDADLNVDNDVVDIYTVLPPDTVHNADMVGENSTNGLLLEVTFNDEAWVHSSTHGTCDDEDVSDFTDNGLASTGFTLMETASGSGVFTGDFQIPNKYCEEKDRNNNGMHVESVTGVDIEVNYYDFRDASGEEVEVGAGAAVRANTGTVSLDRTVYPVPFDPRQYGTAESNVSLDTLDVSGDLMVHIRVNDPDFDVSATGEDKIVNASAYLNVNIIRGADVQNVPLGSGDILEVAPDAGVFELDLPIKYDAGPKQSCPEHKVSNVDIFANGCILQGDIIQVEYRDETDASGEENTVTDSATFDLRNAVLQSDKSVYIIGSDIILTLIEPDFDLDNDGAETYPLDIIEWDSDAGTLGMGCEYEGDGDCQADTFDPEPAGLRETGDSTGIFQSVIEMPAVLDGDRLERGEEIELEYVDYGPSGSDYVGDETEDINLTIFTSNFGATVELDQKVYTWTDKVYITIVAPDHNFDSASVDEIGESNLDPIKVSTRDDKIDNYKLVETGPDTGIFTGEVILIGFAHNADGDATTGAGTAGYDNPQSLKSEDDSGPTNGYISADDDDGITVSFEFSEDETVIGSALIRWNIGEVQWLEASYPATGTGVVRVIDPDMNWNPESVDNFEVDVWSDEDSGGIDLTVTETNQATGIFEGTVFFTIADESSGHRLRVAEGNTVTAEYEDNTLPEPYNTSDELGITATTLIGTIVPPLERAVVSNLRIVDALENSLDTVSVDQQVQIVADLTSGQDRSQEFAYLVQVQDANGVTVSLAWISGTLEAGQSLSPSSSWIPTEAGTYTATAFVWESVDNPTALSPQVTTTITVN